MNTQATSEGLAARALEPTFLDRLADRLELGANARVVFASPVERAGTTVIPVARVRWGIGGGSARRPARDGAPQPEIGGGGGTTVTPMGFIEIGGGRARFRLIVSPALIASTLLAASMLGLSTWRALGSAVRPRALFVSRRRGRWGAAGKLLALKRG